MALIHEKILEIQKDFPVLQKNGVGPQAQGSYKFLAVDDVLDAGRPLLNKHGVIVVPRKVREYRLHYNAAALKEDGRVPRESIQTSLVYVFRLVAVEDGSFQDYEIPAEGIDTQDKSARKAITSAQKVLYIQAFQLATGEIDPDAQDGSYAAQEAAPSSSPAQAKIAKAQGGGVTRKSTGSPTTAGEYRTAILAAVKSGGGVADYEKVGNRISGKQKSEWLNDVEVLSGVLKALEAGEVE